MVEYYYSQQEKICFCITGFHNILVSSIIEDTKMFSEKQQVPLDDIFIKVVDESRRYKNMRVLYAKTENHNDAIILNNSWNMESWLKV